MATKPPPPSSLAERVLEEAKQRRRYALDLKNEGKTNAEVGEVLGISGERARQLITKARQEQQDGA